MAGKLWEIVQAWKVQPDDAIKFDIYSHEIHVDRIIRGGWLIEVYPSKDVLSHRQPVLRRYTGHHPDVLMRALELSSIERSDLDYAACNPPNDVGDEIAKRVSAWIERAEAEIAKERESNG